MQLRLDLSAHVLACTQGGEVYSPEGGWLDATARRVLIYLGADNGDEMQEIIRVERDQFQR